MNSLRCMEFITLREWRSLMLLLLFFSAQLLPMVSGRKECKERNHREKIIGGDDAPKGRYPYMCALYNRGFKFACGGFLIHSKWVLTAAHCVDPNDIRAAYNAPVLCGVQNIGAFDPGKAFVPIITHIHPKYNDSDVSQGYDIALLEFRDGFDLPTPKLDLGRFCELLPGQQFTALGWGAEFAKSTRYSDQLKQATTLQVFEEDHCARRLNYHPKSHHLCAASEQDTCSGDSGGPLLELDQPRGRVDEGSPKKDTIIGITSFGGETCGEKDPGVYIRLSFFSDWIVKTTKGIVKKTTKKCRKETPTTRIQNELMKEDSSLDHRTEIMSVAIENDDWSMVEALLELGVKPDGSTNGLHFLHLAAKYDATESAKMLIGYMANISVRDKKGMTPLMFASQYGHIAILRVLLRNKAPENLQDEDGQTALHHAVIAGHKPIASNLIYYGADVNIEDEKEWTPLHYAASEGNAAIVKLLVDACADVTLTSETGDKPSDVICRSFKCAAEERKRIIGYLS